MKIEKLTRWRGKRIGRVYLVRRLCMVEIEIGKKISGYTNPFQGEVLEAEYGWVPGVVYVDYTDKMCSDSENDEKEFVRTVDRFLERFEQIKD